MSPGGRGILETLRGWKRGPGRGPALPCAGGQPGADRGTGPSPSLLRCPSVCSLLVSSRWLCGFSSSERSIQALPASSLSRPEGARDRPSSFLCPSRLRSCFDIPLASRSCCVFLTSVPLFLAGVFCLICTAGFLPWSQEPSLRATPRGPRSFRIGHQALWPSYVSARYVGVVQFAQPPWPLAELQQPCLAPVHPLKHENPKSCFLYLKGKTQSPNQVDTTKRLFDWVLTTLCLIVSFTFSVVWAHRHRYSAFCILAFLA